MFFYSRFRVGWVSGLCHSALFIHSSLGSDHHLHFVFRCLSEDLLLYLISQSASFPSWVREPRRDSTLATFSRCLPQADKSKILLVCYLHLHILSTRERQIVSLVSCLFKSVFHMSNYTLMVCTRKHYVSKKIVVSEELWLGIFSPTG